MTPTRHSIMRARFRAATALASVAALLTRAKRAAAGEVWQGCREHVTGITGAREHAPAPSATAEVRQDRVRSPANAGGGRAAAERAEGGASGQCPAGGTWRSESSMRCPISAALLGGPQKLAAIGALLTPGTPISRGPE